MRHLTKLVAVLAGCQIACAGDKDIAAVAAANPVDSGIEITHAFETEASYVGGSQASYGNQHYGDVSETAASASYVASPQITSNAFLRLGAAWERYSFDVGNAVPIPNTLQSTNVILGVDFGISDNLLMRFEATPGFYSDFADIDADDFNVPFVLGGSYLVNSKLQWFFGLRVDLNGDMPVLPGFGFRWNFADKWVLNFLLPKPRLEYEMSDKVTLYAGADLRGGTYRVSENFGAAYDRDDMDNSIVSYSEYRGGLGANWKINSTFTVESEGGYTFKRDFDFIDAGVNVETKGAPYGRLGVTAKF